MGADPIQPDAAFDAGAFIDAYTECAFWSSTDNGTPLDKDYGPDDLSDDALSRIECDCLAFIDDNVHDLIDHGTAGQGGHDFWLTRNGHGTGFWARGTGAVGDRLTAAAEIYGTCDLYIGDDGQVYVS